MFGSLGNNDYFCSVIIKMRETYMISFKITMKKTFFISLLALLPLAASAEPVEVDKIWYELDEADHTAVVVASGDEPYAGAIEIPTSIYYDKNYYIVKSIGESAFEECTELTSITISEGIESIELGAFYHCCFLESVVIPNSVKKIGASSFSVCERLKNVSIPNSVTEIGDYAFDYCTSLARINLGITKPFAINQNVFDTKDATYDVYTMALLVVPDGTKALYKETAGWNLFTNIVEASDVGEGGKVGDVFKSGQLYYIIGANNTVTVTSAASDEAKYAGNIEIPEQVSFNYVNYKVTGISNSAFRSCTDLTSVTIPNGVTNISLNAFDGCSNLTSITIPSTVVKINSNAFLGCSNLSSVHITDLAAWCDISFVNSLANPLSYASLFINDKKIVDLEIPNGVTTISNFAFSGYKDITSVTIPSSVISIGKDAFRDCSGLTSIISGIENPFAIDDNVFTTNDKDIYGTALLIVPVGKKSTYQGTDGWKKFTNVVEVGQGGNVGQVFSDNGISYKIGEKFTVSVVSGYTKYAGDIVIPSQVDFIGKTYSVTSIDKSAFKDCTGLKSIKIPSSIKSIGLDAFDGTTALTAVHISDIAAWCNITFTDHFSNPLYYAHHLYIDGKEITDLVIPSSVTSIGGYAFYRCSGLKSIVIPNGVTTIGVSAFYGCSGLTTITIPKSVTSIGETGEYLGSGVFSGCDKLTSILSLNSTPPTSKEGRLISLNYESCVVWVPNGSAAAYKKAAGWKNFKNIKEILDGDVTSDGKISKADVDALVAYIMGKAPEGFNENQADVNGDKKKNVADVVKLIDLLASYGLSVESQLYFKNVDGKQVINSLTFTLKNNRDEAIQLTKCELYCNKELVSSKTYPEDSANMEAGGSIEITFNNLADYASRNGFSVCWYYISNGVNYVYRYTLTD